MTNNTNPVKALTEELMKRLEEFLDAAKVIACDHKWEYEETWRGTECSSKVFCRKCGSTNIYTYKVSDCLTYGSEYNRVDKVKYIDKTIIEQGKKKKEARKP